MDVSGGVSRGEEYLNREAECVRWPFPVGMGMIPPVEGPKVTHRQRKGEFALCALGRTPTIPLPSDTGIPGFMALNSDGAFRHWAPWTH